MNKQYATIVADRSIEAILHHGAQKLYDRYLIQKLPNHANQIQQNVFSINFKMNSVAIPAHQKIEKVPNKIVKNIPMDIFAPKRINIKKYVDQYSTLSPKKSNIVASTKYQTFVRSQNSFTQNGDTNKRMEVKFFPEQSSLQINPQPNQKSDRPMTMQLGRSHKLHLQDSNNQKRASTCHVRKRKPMTLITQQKIKLIKLPDNIPGYIQQQLNQMHKMRQSKTQRIRQEIIHQQQEKQAKYIIDRQERLKRQALQQKKQQIQGKSQEVHQLSTYEYIDGQFTINGKIKPQTKAHVIHLQFNPEEQITVSAIQSKQIKVNGIKKNNYSSCKINKKIKMTEQEFTNNNQRQTSSIPFLALSQGVTMQESTLEVKASRQRPQELTRKKYNSIDTKDRFKSNNKLYNTARINLYQTIQTNITNNNNGEMMESSVLKNPSEKHLQSTLISKNNTTINNNSILWRLNNKSLEKHKIKIQNSQLLKNQLIQNAVWI